MLSQRARQFNERKWVAHSLFEDSPVHVRPEIRSNRVEQLCCIRIVERSDMNLRQTGRLERAVRSFPQAGEEKDAG